MDGLNKKIILASGSPRRLEILQRYFDYIEVAPADVEEHSSAAEPQEIVVDLALQKLKAAIDRLPEGSDDAAVIAADTLVFLGGKRLGKPRHYVEAFDMLKSLSGRVHEVLTGYAIGAGGKTITGSERSVVRFKELDDELIDSYIATGSPYDKAGGYGIQDDVLVAEYSGDYDNIVGLPKSAVRELKKIVG